MARTAGIALGLATPAFVSPAAVSLLWSAPQRFDYGYAPAVAADSQPAYSGGPDIFSEVVVEVHQAKPGDGPLWYRIGAWAGVAGQRTIQWQSAYKYARGLNPSVAISHGKILEVHETSGRKIVYNFGAINLNLFLGAGRR